MKRLLAILSVAAILLASCSSKSTYEKTIADKLQTDKHGAKYDMKFKALDLKVLQKTTVADSIEIINQSFESRRNKSIELSEKMIADSKKNIENENNSRYVSQIALERYNRYITEAQHRIDSLKTTKPDLQGYDTRKKDQVLAIVVECRYSLTLFNTTKEETSIFVLSPDGKEVYAKERVKK